MVLSTEWLKQQQERESQHRSSQEEQYNHIEKTIETIIVVRGIEMKLYISVLKKQTSSSIRVTNKRATRAIVSGLLSKHGPMTGKN